MANTILTILHEYQKFIEKKLIESSYQLPKAPPIGEQGIKKPKHVTPAVTTGCLPHANFSLYGAENTEFFQAPYILVGFDDSSYDHAESAIQLLIQVCCYSSSSYVQDEDNELYDLDIPDNKAFEDCLNLLEWIKNNIISEGVIAGTTVDRPIRLGSYNSKELTYPYSFGYLSFPINTVINRIDRKNLY